MKAFGTTINFMRELSTTTKMITTTIQKILLQENIKVTYKMEKSMDGDIIIGLLIKIGLNWASNMMVCFLKIK